GHLDQVPTSQSKGNSGDNQWDHRRLNVLLVPLIKQESQRQQDQQGDPPPPSRRQPFAIKQLAAIPEDRQRKRNYKITIGMIRIMIPLLYEPGKARSI